ncbi:MAG: c-type cytochrome [Steroidobacteraceae bacterium]
MKTLIFRSALFFMALIAHSALAQDGTVSRGEYVARLANCVACHSAPDGAAFAGGLKMAVPFVGAIYTTNITPDRDTGIGSYTFADFDAAMRKGVAKDGHNLYPAMPYPSYARMTEEDIHALYDFFMNEVQPVRQANRPNEVPGWKSMRWPLAIWNFFFLDDKPYKAKESHDAVWNRGAYLVQGPGHCGACHTPRGLLFQEKGTDDSDADFLAGATLDHWSASSLNSDINAGLGRWSVQDISAFLKTGKNQFGTAFGTMVEVVNNSTHHMTDADLNAVGVYLKSLPAAHERNATPWSYSDATLAALRSPFSQPGAATYYQYCASCHAASGKGYAPHPPLAGNPVVLDPDPVSLINLTLNGSLRVIAEGHHAVYSMPYMRLLLSDQEIADVVTFIRNGWGHQASAVRADQVTVVREATDPVRHDTIVLRMK